MRENDLEGVICEQTTRTGLQAVAPARSVRSQIRKFVSLVTSGMLTFLVMPHAVESVSILPHDGGKVDVVRIDADIGAWR